MLKILFKLQTEGCHTEVPTARWHVNCGLKLFFWPYKEYIRKCTYSNLHVSCFVLLYSPCGVCRILILNKTTDHGNVVHVLWQFFGDFSKFCLKFDVQFQGTRRIKRSRRPFGPSIISAEGFWYCNVPHSLFSWLFQSSLLIIRRIDVNCELSTWCSIVSRTTQFSVAIVAIPRS